MMFKNFLRISVFIATIAIVFSSCKKDDDNQEPSNSLNGKTTAVFNESVSYGTLTDQDGNVYKTVKIGTQTWMAENLRTTKYNDGTVILNEKDNIKWGNLNTGAYCNYNNTINTDTIATYGCLYNWYAVNTGKIAPKGWHVPSNDEWTTLTDYLGGQSYAGGKLKELTLAHWKTFNVGATNETGLTALPGGYRYDGGSYLDLGDYGYWWCATESMTDNAWGRRMTDFSTETGRIDYSKLSGLSIRCVKD